ncbi:MAG: glycosyltransferase family 4 protein [Betaproteobacteria bacterium]
MPPAAVLDAIRLRNIAAAGNRRYNPAMEAGISACLFAPFLAGIVSVATMRLLLRNRSLPLDEPNERSLHVVPVPRTGGLAIAAGVFAAALWIGAGPALLVPAAGLALVSAIDDRRSLPASMRFIAHAVAAGAFLYAAGGPLNPAMFAVLWLAIAWITNLYNFMDGADGLAGGMAVIGFSAYGVAASIAGGCDFAAIAWAIAAAAAGFLAFNFPPARMFMGDVGSIPLGFLAAAMGIAGWEKRLWPLWFPLVVFAPFIVDASMTLLRRLLRGERVWEAHRQHYYQRLILSGWTHRRTALAEYAVMLACAVMALIAAKQPIAGQSILICALALSLVAMMWMVDRRWKRFSGAAHD